jgi:Co/Zn/Cd efflux system component
MIGGKPVDSLIHSIIRKIIPHPNEQIEHWKDFNEMFEVSDKLPKYFKSLMLELIEKPMSREEIWRFAEQIGMRLDRRHRGNITKQDLDKQIVFAIEQRIFEEKKGIFSLTPTGREMAEHAQEVIPSFMGHVFSIKLVAVLTIVVHVLLSILKLAFGFISGSAGLIADGIDNTMDTVSSILVFLGITFNKEKPVSIFIIVLMFVSVGGVGIASYNKIVHPEPIKEGVSAIVVSLMSGLIMLFLSAYQYLVGKRKTNIALMAQAVDSRNHFLTSLLIGGGIILSFLAETIHANWLYYADVVASIFIGILIFKSAIELVIELVKPEEEIEISHFWRRIQEKVKRDVIFDWLTEQLKETSLTLEQLEGRFKEDFCEEVPKIVVLSGMGYSPESIEDLHPYLDQFVNNNKLLLSEGKYNIKS